MFRQGVRIPNREESCKEMRNILRCYTELQISTNLRIFNSKLDSVKVTQSTDLIKKQHSTLPTFQISLEALQPGLGLLDCANGFFPWITMCFLALSTSQNWDASRTRIVFQTKQTIRDLCWLIDTNGRENIKASESAVTCSSFEQTTPPLI